MVLLRSVLFLVFMAVSVLVVALPVSVVGWVLPIPVLGRIGRAWGRANIMALDKICGLGYRVTGWEHLPTQTSIILSKHQSAWETIALRAWLPPEHTWVIKKELLRVPFFGWGIAPFRPIAIDRKAGRQAVKQLLDEGKEALDRGRSVVIFPEGTRVSPGTRGRYGVGGAMLAQKTGYPIVPIAHNAGVFWRRRDLRKYPGTIDVVVGEPMDVAGLSAAEINRRVEDWIEGVVSKLPADRAAEAVGSRRGMSRD